MRKRSANAASATCFCLCESVAAATQHDVVTQSLPQDMAFLD
ncbi:MULTISPECIES: hypothetical protein [Lysinibacillus]|nr:MULTISPECIES: hypothetical protein [Lysinibacillus]